MRKIIRMKRVMKNKDHGLPLFITAVAYMSRFMCDMESELIGGTLKPKYHSDSAGRRRYMCQHLKRKQKFQLRIAFYLHIMKRQHILASASTVSGRSAEIPPAASW